MVAREERGAALPEVEVRGPQGRRKRRRGGKEEEQVLQFVMGGMRPEVFREWLDVWGRWRD